MQLPDPFFFAGAGLSSTNRGCVLVSCPRVRGTTVTFSEILVRLNSHESSHRERVFFGASPARGEGRRATLPFAPPLSSLAGGYKLFRGAGEAPGSSIAARRRFIISRSRSKFPCFSFSTFWAARTPSTQLHSFLISSLTSSRCFFREFSAFFCRSICTGSGP